jgi:hypothetical protein
MDRPTSSEPQGVEFAHEQLSQGVYLGPNQLLRLCFFVGSTVDMWPFRLHPGDDDAIMVGAPVGQLRLGSPRNFSRGTIIMAKDAGHSQLAGPFKPIEIAILFGADNMDPQQPPVASFRLKSNGSPQDIGRGISGQERVHAETVAPRHCQVSIDEIGYLCIRTYQHDSMTWARQYKHTTPVGYVGRAVQYIQPDEA